MHDLVLKGMEVALFADQGHHFSKIPQRDRDERRPRRRRRGARRSLRSAQVSRPRQPRLPNLRQVHLIPASFSTRSADTATRSVRESWVRTSPGQAWTLSGCPSEPDVAGIDRRRGTDRAPNALRAHRPLPVRPETTRDLTRESRPGVQMRGSGHSANRRPCRRGDFARAVLPSPPQRPLAAL